MHKATLENTTGYTQAELDKYNELLEAYLKTLKTDDDEIIYRETKWFADKYLT